MKTPETKCWSWTLLNKINICLPCYGERQRLRLVCYFMKNIPADSAEVVLHMLASSMKRRCPPTPTVAFWRAYFSVCGLPCQREAAMLNPAMWSPTAGEIWFNYDQRDNTRYPFITLDQYEGSIFE